MAGQSGGEIDAGKFPKEPDEGDEGVIDRNLAQQQARQGQGAGGHGAKGADQQGGLGSADPEDTLDDEQKGAEISSKDGP